VGRAIIERRQEGEYRNCQYYLDGGGGRLSRKGKGVVLGREWHRKGRRLTSRMLGGTCETTDENLFCYVVNREGLAGEEKAIK